MPSSLPIRGKPVGLIRLKVLFALAGAISMAHVASTQAQDDYSIKTDVQSSFYLGPMAGLDDATTLGVGCGVTIEISLTEMVSLGFMFENFWLFPDREPEEFNVAEQHLLLQGRIKIPAIKYVELAFDIGFGIGRFEGMVDIPVVRPCFICGKYYGASYNLNTYLGASLTIPICQIAHAKLGIRTLRNFFRIGMMEDSHSFESESFALLFDLGVGMHF